MPALISFWLALAVLGAVFPRSHARPYALRHSVIARPVDSRLARVRLPAPGIRPRPKPAGLSSNPDVVSARAPVVFAAAGLCAAIMSQLPVAGAVRFFRPRAVRSRRAVRCLARNASPQPELDNEALVFVKPHAMTHEVLSFVPNFLRRRGVEVLLQGTVEASEIRRRGIIDCHYASIAAAALADDVRTVDFGPSAAAWFRATYGESFELAIAEGRVHSATAAARALGITPHDLLRRCSDAGDEKVRSGLYCTRLTDGGRSVYVMNGFYLAMREKFLSPEARVQWYVCRFKPSVLPWRQFRGEVIGATDPCSAEGDSLRALLFREWRAFGLRSAPTFQDNGVHASAGPLEALREWRAWLGDDPMVDASGRALVARGVRWLPTLLENPYVVWRGQRGRVFEFLEDVDTERAVEMLAECELDDGVDSSPGGAG